MCKHIGGKHLKPLANRMENICAYDIYTIVADDGGAIIIENTNGKPFYLRINYCPICGEKLFENKGENND